MILFNPFRWNGYIVRKKAATKKLSDDDKVDEEDTLKILNENNDLSVKEEEEQKDKTSVPWKLSLPDEFVNVKFYNKNSYHGYISRKMMEGKGTYRWHNGIIYKVSNMHQRFLFYSSLLKLTFDFNI